MSPRSGNAWAIMKAREKQRQQQRLRHSSVDLGKGIYIFIPNKDIQRKGLLTTIRFEVAIPREGLPMDSHSPITSRKSSPRLNYYYNEEGKIGPHISRVRGSSGPDAGCGCDRGQGWVDKQPSATVAKTTIGQEHQPIEQQHVEGEKKRSRVAVLRPKFSLRDIGKEARKEQSFQEDDKLNGYDDNGNLGESFDNSSQNDFGEGGLYIIRSRKAGVPDVYPQSAPACQTQTMTSSRNSLMSSHADYISCKSARLPSGSEEENLEMSRTKQENVNANANITKDGETGKHVDALISREVSPARSGRYHNSGQGEIIKAQSSFRSLRAERDANTPDLSFRHGYCDGNSSMRKPSGNESKSTRSRTSRNERTFTDTTSTSHGGFAPSPPDPSYQNTITLEQQLFSHAQALHHHMNSIVGRITKTFEGSNSWTMDQILRNVEVMSDTARLLNSRSVSQSDHMMNMQQEMSDIREQVNAAQVEVRRAEQRLQMIFRQEMGKLRRDLNLMSSNGSMVDLRVLQGAQSVPDMNHQPRKGKAFKGKEVNNVAVAENNGKPGNSISPSTPIKGSAHKNPARESSGSPQSRACKLDNSTTLDVTSDNDQALPDKKTVDDPNRNEAGSKTPHIKSIMLGLRRRREGYDNSYSSSSSRLLRTPRRNKNNGNKTPSVFFQAENNDSTKPTAAVSTPPVPPVPASLAQLGDYPNDEQKSPSAIHPALRNARQQQIMRVREQQCQIDYHQAIQDNFL